MISKIFSTPFFALNKFKSLLYADDFLFCTNNTGRYESNPLKSKIVELASFEEFHNFFNNKKSQFDASCYSIASRTLAKILIEGKLTLNFQYREALKTYLTNLQSINFDTLSLTEFSNLLYFLRVLRLDPYNNTYFMTSFMHQIVTRSQNKFKQIQQDSNLNRLCYFYQQYCGLGHSNSIQISKRIQGIIREVNTEVEKPLLSVSEILLILRGMRFKQQISFDQLSLLRNVVDIVFKKHLQNLSFVQLAQISVGINEVLESGNYDLVNTGSVDQIHRKVLANIDEMDEKSIMYLLNASKTHNKIYNQIYRVIFEKIMDQIQPNGESSFNEIFTLRLFNGISNKMKLYFANQTNQEKFFQFLRNTITKSPKLIHNFVQNYIANDFFSYHHLLKLVKILQTIPDFGFRFTFLNQLVMRKMDVEKLVTFDGNDVDAKDRNLVIMANIASYLSRKDGPNKQKWAQIFQKIKNRFFDLYKVQDQTFASLIHFLDTKYILILGKIFRKDIEAKFGKMIESESVKNRKMAMKYYLGSQQQYQMAKRCNLWKQIVTVEQLTFFMKLLLQEKSRDKNKTLDFQVNCLTFFSKYLDKIFENHLLLVNLSRIMIKGIPDTYRQSQLFRNKYWYILNQAITKLQPKVFMPRFTGVIILMLRSNFSFFKYSQQYNYFISKLLKYSSNITSRYMNNQILKESFRLNLIKKDDVATLPQSLLSVANEQQKLLLRMLQKNEFALQGVEITKHNLHLFLFNLCPEVSKLVEQNKDKILTIIADMKTSYLWKCISYYRLGSRRSAVFILQELFKSLNKVNIYYEENNPCYIVQILKKNQLTKYPSSIDSVKTFLRKSLDYFTLRRNINKLGLEDHVNLIKDTNQFRVRSDQYIHAVFQNFMNDHNIFVRQLYLTAGLLGFSLNKRQLDRLVDREFFTNYQTSFSKAFTMFLLLESQIEKPSSNLSIIVKKYNNYKEFVKIPIYSLHFEYLKKMYPEELQGFEPNSVDKADFCKSLEYLNEKHLNLFRSIVEEVTNQKFVQNIVFNNYYYVFRNVAILFPIQTKYFGQNQLLRKIVKELTGVERVAIINKKLHQLKNIVKFLTINYPGMLSPAQEEQIVKRIGEQQANYRVNKQTDEQAQVHEEVAEPNIQTLVQQQKTETKN